jgi:UDP-N-acetylmuramoyl-L-alanyl-D-glutamate--2,6-diaminopimelate ligase
VIKNLLQLIAPLEIGPSDVKDVPISGISADSRAVTAGSLFVAIEGTVSDGHQYIAKAIENGAVAIVFQRPEFAHLIPANIPCVQVADSRHAAAVLADRFWDHPSGSMTLVAVTGTNGKTTTVHLLESIFGAAGHKTGMIGTLGRRVGDATVAASRTTPDAIELQALLAEMLAQGISHVAMELSSHAIDLDRAWGCSFASAVFTNLTVDHLDWHGDMETYRQSKTRLFTDYAMLARPDREMVGAINLDDEAGRLIAAEAKCPVIGYGSYPGAQVRAERVEPSAFGTSFDLVTPDYTVPVRLQLVGPFNVANALAAAACAYGLGIDREAIAAGLGQLECVPGRLEKVDRGQDIAVLVDYAHTPDALENVLRAARDSQPARLICVFGCGGDRDRTKRPVMGKIATKLVDLTVITSDNPRSEDPLNIIAEIKQGAAEGRYVVEADRERAIRAALEQARMGDIVLICGKGHEDYQEFENGRRIHFDDREIAGKILEETRPKA